MPSRYTVTTSARLKATGVSTSPLDIVIEDAAGHLGIEKLGCILGLL
jgi:hypothetical protein